MYLNHHSIYQAPNFSGFWGAFFGAFFAFVFGLITYIITKRRERFVQHKNALVKLERILNKHLNDFGVLEVLIKDMDKILGQGKAYINRLFSIEIPQGIDMEIASIDLINKLLLYQTNIDRINLNALAVNHALTSIEDLYINGHNLEPENFNLVRRLLDGFVKDLPQINERTMRFLVLIRIHNNRTKNRNTFIYGVFNTLWEQKITEEDIKNEREKLETEVKDLMSKDPKDIF